MVSGPSFFIAENEFDKVPVTNNNIVISLQIHKIMISRYEESFQPGCCVSLILQCCPCSDIDH